MNLKQNKNLFSKLLPIVLGLFMVVAAILIISHAPQAFAQSTTTTTTVNGDGGGFVQCGNTAGTPCQIGHLFSTFVVIINYLITMAGFIAVVAIVFAGFTMVYSQGQEQLKVAKGRLSGAIIGLVLVAAAFVLINALFAGSLSIGVKNGANILSSPLEYINSGGATTTTTTPTTKPKAPATTTPATTPKPKTIPGK